MRLKNQYYCIFVFNNNYITGSSAYEGGPQKDRYETREADRIKYCPPLYAWSECRDSNGDFFFLHLFMYCCKLLCCKWFAGNFSLYLLRFFIVSNKNNGQTTDNIAVIPPLHGRGFFFVRMPKIYLLYFFRSIIICFIRIIMHRFGLFICALVFRTKLCF